MFQQEEINLFGRKAFLIKNHNGQTSMTIIPSVGGHLGSLIFEGKNVIDGFQNEEELENNEGFKSALLYPFPNRLKGGQFIFDNKSFQFPVNGSDKNNALHGFGATLPMEVEAIELSEEAASIKLTYDYKGDYLYYPWPFKFSVQFRLKMDQLELRFSVKNTGKEKMPFGLGWHPYYLLPGGVDESRLKLPEVKRIEVDGEQIPNGVTAKYENFATEKLIDQSNFDTGFKLIENSERAEVGITNIHLKSISIWQDSEFQYLQIYIPPNRNTIAVEPMSCNINAFNNQEGLWILKPEEEKTATCGVQYG